MTGIKRFNFERYPPFFFYQTRPQGVLGLVFNYPFGSNTGSHLGPRVQRPLGERQVRIGNLVGKINLLSLEV